MHVFEIPMLEIDGAKQVRTKQQYNSKGDHHVLLKWYEIAFDLSFVSWNQLINEF